MLASTLTCLFTGLAALPANARWDPPPPAPQAASAQAKPPEIVARGTGQELLGSELDPVLIERFARTDPGREILQLLIHARFLEHEGNRLGLEVSDEEVSALWQRLDQEARRAGEPQGLLAEIQRRGVDPTEFRAYLRLSILQERLTLRALDLPPDAAVSGDKQEIWLQQALAENGLEKLPPPYADGLVARIGKIAITTAEFGRELRSKLPREDVNETCWHLLMLKGIEVRMPDLSAEARKRAVDGEMDRRRRKVEAKVESRDMTLEEIMSAKGSSVEALRRDPSVQIAALSRLWVDRTAGEEGLRATFESERSFFEGRFGRALRVHFLFLVASRYQNELNPRTFEMAERELLELKERFGNRDDFAAYAAQYSEDTGTRQAGGDLGWVTRLDPRLPAALRETAFQFLEAGGEIPTQGVAVGPVRLESGCGLLWLSAVRPSPAWDQMKEKVHEELRRRFLEEVMPAKGVEILHS